MTELEIFDTDGLFHNITKEIPTLSGRYMMLVKAGDLDRNNLLSGLDLPKDKYPIAVCLPPTSYPESTLQEAGWELFVFQLFFLNTTYYTGDNQIHNKDFNTNSSLHRIIEDWSEMKRAAFQFIYLLESNQKNLINIFHLSYRDKYRITRISDTQNDRLSGVSLQFSARLALPCDFDNPTVQIPNNNSDPMTEIELRKTSTHIQWRYTGGLWVNLISLAEITGPEGTQGSQGPQGNQGPGGADGAQGLQGLQGIQGTQGIQGPGGDDGEQGIQGIQGLQGIQGVAGADGADGADGPSGNLKPIAGPYTESTPAVLEDADKRVVLNGSSQSVTYTINPATFANLVWPITCVDDTNLVQISVSTGVIKDRNGDDVTSFQLTERTTVWVTSDGTNLWILTT